MFKLWKPSAHSPIILSTFGVLTFVLLLNGLGCGSASGDADPATVAHRTRFLLTSEPAGALSIAEAETKLESSPEVVLIGQIGAGDHEPWEPGKASFVVSELPGGGHGDAPGHDAANCPFCKKRGATKTTLAIVQFLDERGDVLPIDARKLFSLKPGQVVVVQGQAAVNDLKMLVVSAKGIAIRR